MSDRRRFEIQIAGERIRIPVRAISNTEHERGPEDEETGLRIR